MAALVRKYTIKMELKMSYVFCNILKEEVTYLHLYHTGEEKGNLVLLYSCPWETVCT
jgi:hypothetical protein